MGDRLQLQQGAMLERRLIGGLPASERDVGLHRDGQRAIGQVGLQGGADIPSNRLVSLLRQIAERRKRGRGELRRHQRLHPRVPLDPAPDAERQPPAGLQDAAHLAECYQPIRELLETLLAEHHVEGRVPNDAETRSRLVLC